MIYLYVLLPPSIYRLLACLNLEFFWSVWLKGTDQIFWTLCIVLDFLGPWSSDSGMGMTLVPQADKYLWKTVKYPTRFWCQNFLWTWKMIVCRCTVCFSLKKFPGEALAFSHLLSLNVFQSTFPSCLWWSSQDLRGGSGIHVMPEQRATGDYDFLLYFSTPNTQN